MSNVRMRAMMQRLNVDEAKFALANIGLAYAAKQACVQCKDTAMCTDWLGDTLSDDRPTFCPNLRRFEAFIPSRPSFGRPRPSQSGEIG